jgi:hypothetical protein
VRKLTFLFKCHGPKTIPTGPTLIRSALSDPSRNWEGTRSSCHLTRWPDQAQLTFNVRPSLGIMTDYLDASSDRSPNLVYAPLGTDWQNVVVTAVVGRYDVQTPRDWFVDLERVMGVVERFMNGQSFTEGGEWVEFCTRRVAREPQPATRPAASLADFTFRLRDEKNRPTTPATLDSLRSLLSGRSRKWEAGSGGASLAREPVDALLCFLVRPSLGILTTYADMTPDREPTLVYAPEGTDERDCAVVNIGGDDMRIPRAWFLGLERVMGVAERFVKGESFAQGREWDQFLVNP